MLSGFSGAGKTSLLNHLLANGDGLRIAAIVSDPADAQSIEMSNGCERHVLRDDLAVAIERLAAENRFDAVVVESSGITDPGSGRAGFLALAESEGEESFADIVRLDTMVTVVDAAGFLRDYARTESLAERGIEDDEHDDRTIVEVLVEQVEFCDVIVVNKTDLVSADALARLRQVLHALNPRAVLIDARFGDVAPAEVVNTERFDFDETASAAGWLMTLHADPDSAPVTGKLALKVTREDVARHGPSGRAGLVSSRAAMGAGASGMAGGVALQGLFLVGNANRYWRLAVASGRRMLRHGPAGVWWAAQDRSEWPTGDAELEAEIVQDWYGDPDDMTVGDRRQETGALIGTGLTMPTLARGKFDCLSSIEEEWAQGPEGWKRFSDPFPSWDIDEHTHDHDHDDDCDCGHHMH